MTDEQKQSKPPSKRRLVFAAAAGIALGVVCRFVPEPWQIPCTVAVKIVALLMGHQ